MPNRDETGPEIDRRDLLKRVGAAGVAGATGLYGADMASRAEAATTVQATTARTVTDADGNVFLGGDFFELGIREEDGGFGVNDEAPSSFFGSSRDGFNGDIGMFADLDGFDDDSGDQFRYDYFLPGAPEERWSAGYRQGEEVERVVSNGREADTFDSGVDVANIPTSVTATSSGNTLSAELESTFDETLLIDQTYSFKRSNRFFTTDVVLKNVGNDTLNDVRYQRSFDPDNGVDEGCSFTTKNTIVNQPPTSDSAFVQAEIADFDTCALASVSTIPIFFFSEDTRARVSSGSSSFSLVPSPVVYAPEDYDNPPAEGTQKTEDVYIAITFDVGTLEPGQSKSLTFFTALTDNVEETRRDIEEETGGEEEECANRRTLSRGEQDEECPFDRTVERGGSREELDRETDRAGDTRHHDSSTARHERGRRR